MTVVSKGDDVSVPLEAVTLMVVLSARFDGGSSCSSRSTAHCVWSELELAVVPVHLIVGFCDCGGRSTATVKLSTRPVPYRVALDFEPFDLWSPFCLRGYPPVQTCLL